MTSERLPPHGHRRRTAERGSLATTLFVITFIIAVAFSLALMSYQHWLFSRRAHDRQVARNLAESAAALAVAHMLKDAESSKAPPDSLGTFGAQNDFDSVITLTTPGSPALSKEQALTALSRDPRGGEGIAYVCFAPSVKARYHLTRLSRNNTSDSSVAGVGARIPPHSAQIVAYAACHGEIYEMQTVIFVPPAPLALIASGDVDTTGGLVVTGVSDARAYPGTPATIPVAKRRTTLVVSNSTASDAVCLGSGAYIRGRVQAVGGISIAKGNVVTGGVVPNAQAVELPDITVEKARSECFADGNGLRCLDVSGSTGDLEVDWFNHATSGLTVNGDLMLEGGTLVVDGDLHVTGTVHGDGAIIVDGSVTIDRGATLNADTSYALISRGLITLRGQVRNSSYVQGMVYSETGVKAAHLTILGSLFTRNSSGSGSVALDDVNVVCAPLGLRWPIGLPFSTEADDDETIIAGMARPSAGGQLLYSLTAIPFKTDGGKTWPCGEKARFTTLPRNELVERLLSFDDGAPHPGAIGGTIRNRAGSRGSMDNLNSYLNLLATPQKDPRHAVSFDANKLLKRTRTPRFLIWAPL
ncbi:MAG: hypothetical protein EB084_18610 [Proteobacteria bacterium]|nr:hypothetical protein [Pseudomonadota bacterium]